MIQKNMRYYCEKCGALVAIANRELKFMELLTEESCTWPQGHKNGDLLICKNCNKSLKIYLLENWK